MSRVGCAVERDISWVSSDFRPQPHIFRCSQPSLLQQALHAVDGFASNSILRESCVDKEVQSEVEHIAAFHRRREALIG